MGAYYYTLLSPGRCVDVELPDGSVGRAALAVFLGKRSYSRSFIEHKGRNLNPQEALIQRMADAWAEARFWPTHVIFVENRSDSGEKLPPKIRASDSVYRLPVAGEKGHLSTVLCDETDWWPTLVGWTTGPARRGRATCARRSVTQEGSTVYLREMDEAGKVTTSSWPA